MFLIVNIYNAKVIFNTSNICSDNSNYFSQENYREFTGYIIKTNSPHYKSANFTVVNGQLRKRDCEAKPPDTCVQNNFRFIGNQDTLLSNKHIYYEGELQYGFWETKYGNPFFVEMELGILMDKAFPSVGELRVHVTVKNHFTLVYT
jgi:hypothetical protein